MGALQGSITTEIQDVVAQVVKHAVGLAAVSEIVHDVESLLFQPE